MSKKEMAVQGSDTIHGVRTQSDGPKREGTFGGKAPQPSLVPLVKVEPAPPDPEVVEKPVRRRFAAKYKLRVLREADACAPGIGELGALSPKRRGRKAVEPHPLARRVAEFERDNERLRQRLQQAEVIIDV